MAEAVVGHYRFSNLSLYRHPEGSENQHPYANTWFSVQSFGLKRNIMSFGLISIKLMQRELLRV